MIARDHFGLGLTPGQDVQLVGGTAMSIAPLTGPAAPVVLAVGAIVAAAGAIMNALGVGAGCGQNCVNATKVVNQAEPVLKQNVDAYENGQLDQATAQSNYQQVWGAVVQACGGIPGVAGQNCVSDRGQGSCKWKQTAQPKYQGEPNLGECWNWYEAYYMPLTYPSLVPVSSASGVLSSTVSELSSNLPLLLLAVGGLALVGSME